MGRDVREACPKCGAIELITLPCPDNLPGCIVHHGWECLACGHSPEIIGATNIVLTNPRRTAFKLIWPEGIGTRVEKE